MKSRLLLLVLVAITSFSCNSKTTTTSDINQSEVVTLHYAKGFQVVKKDNYTHITIRNPWDSTTLLHSYILVNKNKEVPENLPKGTLIRTPISKAVTTSAIQCSYLNELNSLEIVAGVCEPQYIKQDYITQGVANGKIMDIGMANNPSSEAIMLLSPDVVFSDPVTGRSQASIEKTKIPIIQTSDYTEPHPLGRAEWIRFYSLFVKQENLADSLFMETEKRYNEVKKEVTAKGKLPTVFIDTRYQGNWNMPGGQSYMATLLKDGGANYLWADNESATFLPLSFEAVLDKAGEGDKWLMRYFSENDMTYSNLANEYKPYTYFKAFKEKEIYGCNTMYTTFYDDLPIHPDYILKDLAKIFHPDLFPDYESRYYKELKD